MLTYSVIKQLRDKTRREFVAHASRIIGRFTFLKSFLNDEIFVTHKALLINAMMMFFLIFCYLEKFQNKN